MKLDVFCKRNCSTFTLKDDHSYLIGHNLDSPNNVPGAVFINPRGVEKRNISFQELISGEPSPSPTKTWIANFGSVTFNTAGKEFIDGGINEAGLFIQEMTLIDTQYPNDEKLPMFFMEQWMQYLLDNFKSLNEVLDDLSKVSIDGWPWHFYVADTTGKSAVIQFIEGKAQIYTGESLPYPLLCNALYPRELEQLNNYTPFGGKLPIAKPGISIEEFGPVRFAIGAEMIQNKLENFSVDYAFDILQAIGHPDWTKWSYVIDVLTKEVHFKTNESPQRKSFVYQEEDFSIDSAVKLINIHTDNGGDVKPLLDTYTEEQNAAIVDAGLDGFIQYENALKELGGSLANWRRNMKAFPASLKTVK